MKITLLLLLRDVRDEKTKRITKEAYYSCPSTSHFPVNITYYVICVSLTNFTAHVFEREV